MLESNSIVRVYVSAPSPLFGLSPAKFATHYRRRWSRQCRMQSWEAQRLWCTWAGQGQRGETRGAARREQRSRRGQQELRAHQPQMSRRSAGLRPTEGQELQTDEAFETLLMDVHHQQRERNKTKCQGCAWHAEQRPELDLGSGSSNWEAPPQKCARDQQHLRWAELVQPARQERDDDLQSQQAKVLLEWNEYQKACTRPHL